MFQLKGQWYYNQERKGTRGQMYRCQEKGHTRVLRNLLALLYQNLREQSYQNQEDSQNPGQRMTRYRSRGWRDPIQGVTFKWQLYQKLRRQSYQMLRHSETRIWQDRCGKSHEHNHTKIYSRVATPVQSEVKPSQSRAGNQRQVESGVAAYRARAGSAH